MKIVKKFFVYLGGALTLILISALVFFLWASSPNYSEKEYTQELQNTYAKKINSDSIYSVVTYNIGYLSGMTNNRAIAKPEELFISNLKKVKIAFESLDADIIAFQEIDYDASRSYFVNQQNEIAKLGYNYVAQAINWDETYVPFPYWPPSMHFGKMLSGQSILSKYPLNNHKRIVLDRVESSPFYRDALYLERLAQIASIKIEDKEVYIINVHLEAFDKTTRVKQFEKIVELFNNYAKTNPTILLGDFNSLARDKEAVILKLFNLPSIGVAAFKGEIQNTYSSVNPFKRIDYIFYTKASFEYIDGMVLNQFGEVSDHLPVEMKFKLK